MAEYVRNLQNVSDLEAIAKDIFKHSQVNLSVDLESLFAYIILCELILFSRLLFSSPGLMTNLYASRRQWSITQLLVTPPSPPLI